MNLLLLFAEEREARGGGVGFAKQGSDFFDNVRMLTSDVSGFADVGLEVVQHDRGVGIIADLEAESFPVTHANGLGVAVGMEFPVEVFVLALLATEEGGGEGDAVDASG